MSNRPLTFHSTGPAQKAAQAGEFKRWASQPGLAWRPVSLAGNPAKCGYVHIEQPAVNQLVIAPRIAINYNLSTVREAAVVDAYTFRPSKCPFITHAHSSCACGPTGPSTRTPGDKAAVRRSCSTLGIMIPASLSIRVMYSLTSMFAVFIMVFLANESRASDSGLTIKYGKNNPICRDVERILQRTEKTDFLSDNWRNNFTKPVSDSYPLKLHGAWATVTDIDNDGKVDLVVSLRGSIRSVEWDWLFVTQPENQSALQEIDTFESLERVTAQLNPNNDVKFTNGASATPVSTLIWEHGQRKYLVLQEFFFAHAEQYENGVELPSSLYVGVLDGKSTRYYEPLKLNRLVPKMLCRMIWR